MGAMLRQLLNASRGRCQWQHMHGVSSRRRVGFHHARECMDHERRQGAANSVVHATRRVPLEKPTGMRAERSQMEAQRELLKADPADVLASSLAHECAARPWPEWTSFLQHLKSLPFFKESPEAVEFGAADDSTNAKRMLAEFSQAYAHIFDCLSVTHLRVLAEYGSPKDDRRTVASGNRLQNFLQIKEKRVAINLCDSKPANPKLSDVMRLIYTIAEVARKSPDEVKHSILHLLEEMISKTSNHKHQMIVYSKSSKDSGLVLQQSLREKSLILEAKAEVEGSSFLCDAKMLSQYDKWTCPRCSCMNWQSKSKCTECSFQLTEKGTSDIDSIVHKSSMQSTNMMDIKICVSDKKSKEKALLVSQEAMEILDLDNDRQVAIREAMLEQWLTNIPRAAQEQQGLQKCTLSEDVKGNFHQDVSDVDEQSDTFDDIFDSADTSSLKTEQKKFTKCLLSDLVRQNIKAFSSSNREKGAATGTDDFDRERPLIQKGSKLNDLDVTTRCISYGAKQTDSFMELEDSRMLPYRSGGKQPSSGLSIRMARNQSYSYKAGMRGKHSW